MKTEAKVELEGYHLAPVSWRKTECFDTIHGLIAYVLGSGDEEYEDVRSIEVVDIHGDTIKITGGATCHLDKKVKK